MEKTLGNNFFGYIGLLEESRINQHIVTGPPLCGQGSMESPILFAKWLWKWDLQRVKHICFSGSLTSVNSSKEKGTPNNYAHSTIMQIDWLQLDWKQ